MKFRLLMLGHTFIDDRFMGLLIKADFADQQSAEGDSPMALTLA